MKRLPDRIDPVDRRITHWMAAHGVRLTRLGLGVVFLWFGIIKQMSGTMLPLFLFPAETFNAFPHAPTLEGAAIVVGATVRGGRLEAEAEDARLDP